MLIEDQLLEFCRDWQIHRRAAVSRRRIGILLTTFGAYTVFVFVGAGRLIIRISVTALGAATVFKSMLAGKVVVGIFFAAMDAVAIVIFVLAAVKHTEVSLTAERTATILEGVLTGFAGIIRLIRLVAGSQQGYQQRHGQDQRHCFFHSDSSPQKQMVFREIYH